MTLSFADIESQHAELLPARTVMTLFTLGNDASGSSTARGRPAGPVSCGLLGIGNVSLGLGLLLASGAADGSGTACSATTS